MSKVVYFHDHSLLSGVGYCLESEVGLGTSPHCSFSQACLSDSTLMVVIAGDYCYRANFLGLPICILYIRDAPHDISSTVPFADKSYKHCSLISGNVDTISFRRGYMHYASHLLSSS